MKAGSSASDFLQNVFSLFGPDKCSRVGIVMVDVIANCLNQLGYVAEDAVTNTVLSDVAKPSLNNVQPRTTCGSEVDVKASMACKP